jgi:type VI secretion system secreted protein Hcp
MTNKTVLILAISAISVTAILGIASANTAVAVGGGGAAPWIADINNLQTLLQNQITTLTNNLNNEAVSRQAGDTALSSQITDLSNLITNPPPKPSLTDAFLMIDGIPGESTDSMHPGTIEIDSWSWGETQTGTSGGGGGGTGKVSMQDIHFVTKKIDKSSPKLLLFTANGEHIKDATLFVRKAGGSFDYLQIKLNDVLVSSYQTGGSSDIIPTESFSLNFAKFQYTYTGTDDNVKVIPPITTGWDVLANKVA